MKAILPLFVLVLTLLAGCSGGASKDSSGQSLAELEHQAQNVPVQATATTGVIRGLVVDDAVRPIPGVNITMVQPPMSTTTNEAGAFGFDGLEPGTYFFQASRHGYTQIQSSADVVAGDGNPETVRIQMVQIALPIPFIETLQSHIFVSGSGWVAGVGGITVSSLTGEGNYFFQVDVTPNGTIAQTELVWDATTILGQESLASGGTFDGNDAVDANVWTGPSPLVMQANATSGNATSNSVSYAVFAWPSGGLPVGAHANQKVDAFVNVFHNFRPRDGWTFTGDGPHPIPPP